MQRKITFIVAAIIAISVRSAQADGAPAIEPFFAEGRLADGEAMLLDQLKQSPDNSEAKLSLGVVRTLITVEQLGQNLYRHGSSPRNFFLLGQLGGQMGGGGLPILRMPVPKNPNPEPIDYERFREIVAEFLSGLEKAASTLAAVNDADVKLPLNFGRIRLDLDGNGATSEGEELWRILSVIQGRARASTYRELTIAIDQADAHWLRGYCHLLSGICEIMLAYDQSELFNRCGSMVFPKVDSPVDQITGNGDFIQAILDEAAAIHLASFPLLRRERTVKAHRHFKGTIEQSRAMWVAIEAETDSDREWIPGQHQSGVVSGVRMTKEMIAGWREFLVEAEDVLDGKKLIPFWRGDNKKLGVNLRRVFHEPRKLDLILWANGAAAIPYLEEGEVSKPSVWDRFNRIFRGNFIGFAIWIN